MQEHLQIEGDKEEGEARSPRVYTKPSPKLYEHSLHALASSLAYPPFQFNTTQQFWNTRRKRNSILNQKLNKYQKNHIHTSCNRANFLSRANWPRFSLPFWVSIFFTCQGSSPTILQYNYTNSVSAQRQYKVIGDGRYYSFLGREKSNPPLRSKSAELFSTLWQFNCSAQPL